ncbi:MAG: hypothetical protein WDN69_32335 [Aliidongia sp.]
MSSRLTEARIVSSSTCWIEAAMSGAEQRSASASMPRCIASSESKSLSIRPSSSTVKCRAISSATAGLPKPAQSGQLAFVPVHPIAQRVGRIAIGEAEAVDPAPLASQRSSPNRQSSAPPRSRRWL